MRALLPVYITSIDEIEIYTEFGSLSKHLRRSNFYNNVRVSPKFLCRYSASSLTPEPIIQFAKFINTNSLFIFCA